MKEIGEFVAALVYGENAELDALCLEAARLTPLDRWTTLCMIERPGVPPTVGCMLVAS